jgi:hypothetical protein
MNSMMTGTYIGWRRDDRAVLEYEVNNVEESPANARGAAAEICAHVVEWHGANGTVVRRNEHGRRLTVGRPR